MRVFCKAQKIVMFSGPGIVHSYSLSTLSLEVLPFSLGKSFLPKEVLSCSFWFLMIFNGWIFH